MFKDIKCPHCGRRLTIFITEYKGNKAILDACPKCGKKTTEEQESN